MDDILHLTTKDAILYVSENLHGFKSMYSIAKALSDDELTVHTIQISNYLKGTKMSRKVADRFTEVFDIIITDVHDTSATRRNYNKSID